MSQFYNNIVQFNNTSLATKPIDAIETTNINTMSEFLNNGSKVKTLTTVGGKTIGYYTSNDGTIQLVPTDSTTTTPVHSNNIVKLDYTEGEGYKITNVEGGSSIGQMITTAIPSGIILASLLNNVGVGIKENYYDQLPQGIRTLMDDQKYTRGILWDIDVSVPKGDWQIYLENHPDATLYDAMLYDIDNEKGYICGDMALDMLRDMGDVLKLTGKHYQECTAPFYTTFKATNDNYITLLGGESTGLVRFVMVGSEASHNTNVYVVSSSEQQVYYQVGENIEQLYVNTPMSYGGRTFYYKGLSGAYWDEARLSTPLRPDDTQLTSKMGYTALWGIYELPNGMVDKPLTFDADDYAYIQENDNPTALERLREKFSTWFDNAINLPIIEDGEKKDNWFLPITPPSEWQYPQETPDTKPLPWDFPITENQPQTYTGVNPDLQKWIDTALEKGIDILTDDDPQPVRRPKVRIDDVPEDITDPYNDPVSPSVPNRGKTTGEGDTPLPVVPTLDPSTGLGGVYCCTKSEIASVNSYLWSSEFWAIVEKMITNPMDAVIGLHQVYFTPSVDSTPVNIFCGCQDTHVSSHKVNERFYEINCGHILINELYGNVYDYDPYTEISIYLPFIGIVSLDVSDIMRSRIDVVYNLDVCSGCGICNIYVTRDGHKACLYTYGCQVSSVYPLSGRDFTGLVESITNLGTSIVTKSPSGIISGVIGSVLNSQGKAVHSGAYGGNTGALNNKKPYLIISRAIPMNPNNYNHYYGYPSNYTLKIGSCQGYTQVTDLHLDTTNMLYEDIVEIETLLSNGVIL